jgi:heat shock protein HslJ
MRRTGFALLVVGVTALAACTSSGSAKPPTTSGAAATTTTVSAGAAALQGPVWSLTAVGTMTVPATLHVTATFNAGTLSGSSGCNSYSAPYTLDGARLSIGPTSATLIGCPPPVARVENTYLGALAKVATYTVESGVLTLKTSDSMRLTYIEQQRAVLGS